MTVWEAERQTQSGNEVDGHFFTVAALDHLRQLLGCRPPAMVHSEWPYWAGHDWGPSFRL